MNKDEDYGFDVAGYLHIPQLLSADEIEACNRAIDAVGREDGMLDWPEPWCAPFRALQEHAVLHTYLESFCGTGFAQDSSPVLVSGGSGVISAADAERRRRLRYMYHGGKRVCHGLRVIWALTSPSQEGGILLVPGSHNRWIEPSDEVLQKSVGLGMTELLRPEPGDLILCASTTMYGVQGDPGRLVESEFRSARAMPSGGPGEVEPPSWTADLTPEQKAVVGMRTTGIGGFVVSDGKKTRVAREEELPGADSGLAAHLDADPEELWFWDVRGYLVLRGVMDEAWLGAANRAIEAALAMQEELPEDHPTKLEEVRETALIYNDGEWPKDTSSRLRGDIHRPRLGGLYLLPKPHCAPFHRMIAHPAITRRLNWMLGYGHSETGEPMCCEYPQGTTGGSLHGQNTAGFYRLEGRSMVEKVNVAWALHDEAPGFGKESGGFVCIPGSHKASYPIPRGLTTSIDLPQVYKPPLKAGDVLLFGALAHGTTAWRASWHRRTVIQFMGSRNVSIRPANPVVGWRGRRLSGSWRV